MAEISRKALGLATFVTVTLLLLLLRFPAYPSRVPGRSVVTSPSIPNRVHFVYILSDPDADFSFRFKHFLSVYAAWFYWKPQAIYLHTNANQGPIDRARDGTSGKWNQLIFGQPGLRVNHVSAPSHADNGVEIQLLEHKSDFVRVQVVRDFGGIYLDFDAYALRDIRILREAGFNAIGGTQVWGDVISGTFMSKKDGMMVSIWFREMHQVYDGGWVTHSNNVITRIGERLVAEPGEMLILDRQALAPGSASPEDWSNLFDVHDDVPSEMEGGQLASHKGNMTRIRDDPRGEPPWATSWARTYVLHAFAQRQGSLLMESESKEYITPRYMLEGRSNFARALYPVVKDMYDGGLITVED